jgi:cation transport regulator ChaB
MLFKTNNDLPKEFKQLPDKAQTIFREYYNKSYSKNNNELLSFKIAWNYLKTKFKKVNNEWVAQGLGYDIFTFDMENKSDIFIQQADDGNYYMEAVLADTLPVMDGWSFTENALNDFAKQINQENIFGGLTNGEYQDLIMKYSHLPSDEFVKKARTERKGILKSIKAIVDKGKLIIKAIIDKRYINHAKKFNKISIEALIPLNLQKNMKYLGGKILGFALDNNPKNPRTKVRFD